MKDNDIKKIEDLKFDDKNFNRHTQYGQKLLEDSLRKFGAGRSILIDKNGKIVAGNGIAETAADIGIDDIIIVKSDGTKLVAVQRTDIDLDTPHGREMALADNQTSVIDIDIDEKKVWEELGEDVAKAWSVDMPEEWKDEDDEKTIEEREREFRERMAAGEISEEDEEYQEFLEKFKLKKTTDDCYTPEVVYNAIVSWVTSQYGVKQKDFVRPFYPGGDYQKYIYPKNCVVVDNPPFSILHEILQFYREHNVKFFLFAPALTLFSSSSQNCTALAVGASITYANGASVNTSFLTNLEDPTIRLRSMPSLHHVVTKANEENLRSIRRELPKYTYPDNIITAPFVARLSKYDIDFMVSVKESEQVSALDSQKENGKTIFGKGYIVGEKAAAEKAAAEKAAAEKAAATRWQLSDREKEIIKKLSR